MWYHRAIRLQHNGARVFTHRRIIAQLWRTVAGFFAQGIGETQFKCFIPTILNFIKAKHLLQFILYLLGKKTTKIELLSARNIFSMNHKVAHHMLRIVYYVLPPYLQVRHLHLIFTSSPGTAPCTTMTPGPRGALCHAHWAPRHARGAALTRP